MTPACSRCKRTIAAQDINVAQDLAYCRPCNQAHKLSDLVHGSELPEPDVTRPPAGAWYSRTGLGAVIGVSHRSVGGAIGALAISVFWNGIVSVFLFLVVSSTFNLLGVPVPDWFPTPKMNGQPMGWGMTLFLWVFLTPFILVGLAMIGAFLSALAGRTEIRIQQGHGVIFTGVGPFGWRRRFNPQLLKDVRVNDESWRDSDGDRRRRTEIMLEMEDGKRIRLGSSLPEDRRNFLAAALRAALRP